MQRHTRWLAGSRHLVQGIGPRHEAVLSASTVVHRVGLVSMGGPPAWASLAGDAMQRAGFDLSLGGGGGPRSLGGVCLFRGRVAHCVAMQVACSTHVAELGRQTVGVVRQGRRGAGREGLAPTTDMRLLSERPKHVAVDIVNPSGYCITGRLGGATRCKGILVVTLPQTSTGLFCVAPVAPCARARVEV